MTSGRTILLALALSLGGHALVLVLPGPASPPVSAADPVELEVLRLAPAAPPGPGPAKAPAPPPPLTRAARPETPAPAGAPRSGDDAPLSALPVEAAAAVGSVAAGVSQAGAAAGAAASHAGAGAAAGGGAGDGGDDAALLALYTRRLQEAVLRAFSYPRRAQRDRLEGRVLVEVVLAGAGPPLGVRLARSSGHAQLDRAALETVRGVHFPAPPAGLEPRRRSVEIPVDYAIR